MTLITKRTSDSSLLFSLTSDSSRELCSFHPCLFLVIPKRFPSHFGRQSFTSIKTTSQRLENHYASSHNHGGPKKWVPSNSTHISKYSRFSTKNHDCGRKKAQNRGFAPDPSKRTISKSGIFFHAEKGADKSLSSMYSLSSVAHWSATSGQSRPNFREKK